MSGMCGSFASVVVGGILSCRGVPDFVYKTVTSGIDCCVRGTREGRCVGMWAIVVAIVAGLCLSGAVASAASAEPAPFGHACKAQDGVRFCPTEGLEQRVHSFDGVP